MYSLSKTAGLIGRLLLYFLTMNMGVLAYLVSQNLLSFRNMNEEVRYGKAKMFTALFSFSEGLFGPMIFGLIIFIISLIASIKVVSAINESYSPRDMTIKSKLIFVLVYVIAVAGELFILHQNGLL